ncbi:polyketide synthase [Serratia marcescens]|uniref:Polyketide synthase n=1 Tax=Serratia marcescens TaxID=615 RepID=A0A1Q4P5G4_SERMA|nr:type I polyketide synthase [Serratia marcescens]OKB68339.1 polyketide synthase [Serratia marcescens]
MQQVNSNERDIALVGMACRFPGAEDTESWWHNLINGVESLVRVDNDRGNAVDSGYIPVAAPIAGDISRFDAGFFGLSAREALLMDPQQRLFLECAWHALESAGVTPGELEETGLFAGCSGSDYLRQAEGSELLGKLNPSPFERQIASDKDYLTSRVAWHLGIGGPVCNVQAACATSLVAVYEAVHALRSGRCNMALAGACTLRIPQDDGYFAQQGMVFSTDGHCRPFSADASGTVFGSGVGVVVMKRLTDALAAGDDVIAVIKGVAMNNDGARKVSFTTTSLHGQQRLLRQAMDDARLAPEAFRAIEAHGTGTLAGDPIEFDALNSVFRERSTQRAFCAIGAVKANVGHLETCAGMAGLIKAALQIRHGWIAPQINFASPNPEMALADSPFEFICSAQRWERDDPRQAIGVSAFGIGGTNAHVVLARPPQTPPAQTTAALAATVVPISAQSEQAWHRLAKRYLQRPCGENDGRLAWSAQSGRKPLRYRGTLHIDEQGVLSVKENMVDTGKGRLSVVFQFPGQGSQFIGMASDLMAQDATFRKLMDDKLQILQTHAALDLSPLFTGQAAPETINDTALTQPALIAVEIAVAELLKHYGVEPDWVVGHSLGEIAAAWAAGVFSTHEALLFAARRGRLMAGLQSGMMLAVELSAQQVQPWLGDRLSLAAENSENGCVLSGAAEAIRACERQMRDRGVRCKALNVSHAFHSALMDPILDELAALAPPPGEPTTGVRYVSALLATEIAPAALDGRYWSRHAREPVNYHRALQHIPRRGKTLFVEVGPGSTLTALVAQLKSTGTVTAVRTLPRRDEAQSESAVWIQALQKIWRASVNVNWRRLWQIPPSRIALPMYPFDPAQWWLGERDRQGPEAGRTPAATDKPDPEMARIWRVWGDVTGVNPDSNHCDFFDAGGQSLMALRLMAMLEQEFGQAISMAGFLQRPTPWGIKQQLDQAGAFEQESH